MNWSLLRRSVLFAALAVTIAGTAIGAKKGTNRPFKLEGETAIVAGAPGEEQTTAGTGKGSHLGKFTSSGTVQFDEPAGTQISGSGTQTFTAANGDQLFFSFSGTLDLLTLTATVPFEVTGGTGRFSDASGSIISNIQADPSLTSFTFTANGTISY
jgi:hypothetical protein